MTQDRGRQHRRQLVANAIIERLLHDLKQPANLIRVLAQEVKLDVRRSRLRIEDLPESMAEIESGVDDLTRMLDRLRIFFRPSDEDVNDDPDEARCDVRVVCERTASELRALRPTIELKTLIEDGLPAAAIPEADLDQALWELLDNASRAVQERGSRVSVMASREGEEIRIAVRDDGPGIAPNLLTRVIDPFFSTRDDGSGLGLPIARALVSFRGGDLEVAPVESGAQVVLTLRSA